MAINDLRRKENYFSIRTKIKAVEIDSEFNRIVDFLNNDIILNINNLISNQFVGSSNVALLNSFLTNNGDGTAKWDFIKLDSFEYNGTSLRKFEIGTPNSIIAVDNLRNYTFVTPTEDNQVLISIFENLPTFDYLSNDCFEDRCILGLNVLNGSIGEDNIDANTYLIADNSIPTIKFANNSVTEDTLENGDAMKGIAINKFTQAIQLIFPTMITSNMIPDGYLSNDFDFIFTGPDAYSALTAVEYQRFTNLNVEQYAAIKFTAVDNSYIDSYNLNLVKLNSINGMRLQYTSDGVTYLPNINDILGDGCILPEHLDVELKTLFGF